MRSQIMRTLKLHRRPGRQIRTTGGVCGGERSALAVERWARDPGLAGDLQGPGVGRRGNRMKPFLRRLWIAAGMAITAWIAAELLARTAFSRLVRSDVQTLRAGSSTGEATFVSETMLDGLPEPVQRYLRYTGVIGKPFVRTVRLK